MSDKNRNESFKVFIALACLAASGIGIVSNCTGVFYNALSAALSVNRASVTAYMTIESIVSAIASVYSPKIINQQNFKKILLLSSATVSLSLVLIGQAKSIYFIYFLAVLLGLGMSFFANSVVNLLITNNIHENVGKLSSLIFMTCGIMGIVLSPILTGIIESSSYSIGYIVAGGLCFVLALPCQFLDLKVDFKDEKKPESTNSVTSTYIHFMCMSFMFYVVTNFPQHLLGYAEVKGFSSSDGAFLLSAAMAGNVAFKPINGTLSDKIGSIRTSMIIIFINLLGAVLLLISGQYFLLILGCFLYGTNYTMTSFMHALLCRDIFPDSYYSVFPKMLMSGVLGAAAASVLIGACYDLTGDYRLALYVIICLDLFNIVSLWILHKKAHK